MADNISSSWQRLIPRRVDLLLVIAAFAVGLTGYSGYLSGDYLHLPPWDGTGSPTWDPSVYSKFARDFYGTLTEVGPYRMQRLLPSAIVYHTFRLFSVPLEDSNILHGFIILNAILITLIGYLFVLTANKLEISSCGKWLGFVGLFINFAVLKHNSYSPMTTDTSAYALGMMLLYFYVTRNVIGLYVTTALGMFVWPTLLIEGVSLIAFLPGVRVDGRPPGKAIYLTNAAGIISLLCGFGAFLSIIHLRNEGFSTPLSPFMPTLYLSMAVTVLYIFWGMKDLLSTGELLNIKYLLSHLANMRSVLRLIIVAVLVGVVEFVQHALAPEQRLDYAAKRHLMATLWVSSLYPGVFFVAHVNYFGPVIILLLFLWKQVCQLIHQHGVGLGLCATACFALSLDSESRHLINFLPVLVVFLAKATDYLLWRRWQYWLVSIAALLLSKVWLTIGQPKLYGADVPATIEGKDIPALALSNQRLFMNYGPGMSGRVYVIQALAVLLVGFIIYYFCFNSPTIEKSFKHRK